MKDNITIFSNDKEFSISFYTRENMIKNDYEEYEKFIAGCEHAVRSEDRYAAYVGEMHAAGLNKCAVLGNVSNGNKVKLEMHHGPLFTLFDICDIVTRHCLREKMDDITTFKIADIVLDEHKKDNVQVVMLSETPHKAAHRELFINAKASFGRVDRFIEKYQKSLTQDHLELIEHYIKLCKEIPETVDNGLFATGKKLKSFK